MGMVAERTQASLKGDRLAMVRHGGEPQIDQVLLGRASPCPNVCNAQCFPVRAELRRKPEQGCHDPGVSLLVQTDTVLLAPRGLLRLWQCFGLKAGASFADIVQERQHKKAAQVRGAEGAPSQPL